MFSSRRRRTPNPPADASHVNPNAATAALSAFNRRGSNGNLSAAAAAAALKARPQTPTNVADVQTKRTMRRSSSIVSASSNGTVRESNRPAGLERRRSSSSMSERTFRSPSPHRPSSSGGVPRTSIQSDDPPPVPSIPKHMETRAGRTTGGGGTGAQQHQKKPSIPGLGSPPMRVASQKLGKEGSGSWFGAARAGDASNVRTSDAAMAIPPLADNEPRPESRGSSVNFSYPARARIASPPPDSITEDDDSRYVRSPPPETSPRPTKRSSTKSPRPSSMLSDSSLIYDPNSRRFVQRPNTEQIEHRVHEAAEQRPRKKKEQTPTRAGSHLAQGTVARSHGSVIDSGAVNEAQKAAAASLRSHRPEEPRHDHHEAQLEHEQLDVEAMPLSPRKPTRAVEPEPEPQPQPQAQAQAQAQPQRRHELRSSYAPSTDPREAPAASTQQSTERRQSAQLLGRKPSVVKEESEPEPEETETHVSIPPQNAAAALDALPIRQKVYQQPEHQQPQELQAAPVPAAAVIPPPVAPADPPAAHIPPPETQSAVMKDESQVLTAPQAQAIKRERSVSNSPARTAHFGTVSDNLTVRHSPPPRSISPRKSALKQHSPSRGASPASDASDRSGAGANQKDDAGLSRKKSVRVSFDDGNTVVVGRSSTPEQTDSPILVSPQNARKIPWLSNIGLGKKKDFVPLDDDEIMKPRPALPSFGSVREKKQQPKEQEERPLVRPLEPPVTPPEPASPAVHPTIPSATEAESLGQSSDHAVGALLHDQASRNEANISKFREPLPPVVTSIEGSGYISDSGSSDHESTVYADAPRLEPEASQASTLVADAEETKPPNGIHTSPTDTQQVTVEAKDFARGGQRAETPEPEAKIPAISITQPSPGPSAEKERERSYLDVPGTFPETESDMEDTSKIAISGPTPVPAPPPVRQVTFEPVVHREDVKPNAQTPRTVLATQPLVVDDTDTDDSAVYSDAYEDLSDIEGDGFLSLDAVVDSPLITQAPKSAFVKAAERQQAQETKEQPESQQLGEQVPPVDDWEAAKSYWRSLTADKRAQLEKEAMEEAGAEGDLEGVKEAAKKPRRKKSVEQRNAEKKAIEQQRAVEQQKSIDPDRVYMIKPGTKAGSNEYKPPHMKSSMRGDPPSARAGPEPGTRMRKSMRGSEAPPPGRPAEAQGRMRKSLRDGAPPAYEQHQSRAAPSKSARPMSLPAGGPAPQISKGHARTMSDTTSPGASPQAAEKSSSRFSSGLRRRGSDSSTSSFKRARSKGSEGFGFRSTMRGGPAAAEPVESGRPSSSRFSLRSLSPSGSPFRRSSTSNATPPSSMGSRMKTTMRSSAEPQGKSSSFGRSLRGKSGGKKSSRFGDSSDEDDGAASGFRSRFEDSSDEEPEPIPLPPLSVPKKSRGVAPGIRGQASTSHTVPEESEELPDSDEEGEKATNAATSGLAAGTLRRSRSGRGEMVNGQNAPPLGDRRPSGHSRRSSFGAFLRRKKHDEPGKITRPERIESAARRDTKLERTPDELNAIRSNSLTQQTGSPKLQKRSTSFPAPVRNDSWPLPDAEDKEEEAAADLDRDDEKTLQRPSTSGNLDAAKDSSRPAFLQRRTMSTQGTLNLEQVGSGEKKKKKKFGALRRMFKLDD